MIEDQVKELRIRVSTDGDTDIRPTAERMARAALERCAAVLEARAPGRVVLVRRLPLRWRIDAAVLDDDAELDALAQAAADAIERCAVPAGLDPPPPGVDAVLFENEAHLRASHLLALARAGPVWVHATLEEPGGPGPLAALAGPQRRALALATLGRLASRAVLAEVLAAQSAPAASLLATALGFDSMKSPPDAATSGPAVSELAAATLVWPPLPAAAYALALRIHAACLLNIDADAPEAGTLAGAAVAHLQAGIGDVPPPGSSTLAPLVESVRGNAGAEDGYAEPREVPERNTGHPGGEDLSEATTYAMTRFAGLFYLLDRVQEIDLAEALWQVCLPEGEILAAAAAALLGPDAADDGAARWFGGVSRIACPAVTPDQATEVAAVTCAALAAALPRRGLADIPPITVALAEHTAGRLLIAAAGGSPFVFFAWPATTRDDLRAGLRALLDAWPHRGVMNAAPALVTLDAAARLRPAAATGRAAWLLPEAASAPQAALLALAAGAPCTLFAARAGPPFPDEAAAFVRHHLRRRARVALGPGRMEILLAADDVDLRRGGLDRNPGWLPWLRRTVGFIFKQDDPARSGE
jgi:hypothetical protein